MVGSLGYTHFGCMTVRHVEVGSDIVSEFLGRPLGSVTWILDWPEGGTLAGCKCWYRYELDQCFSTFFGSRPKMSDCNLSATPAS